MIFEDGCVRESFAAFLALIWPSIGVDTFVANLLAAIVEMSLAVQTLVGSFASVPSYVSAQFSHLTK